MVIRSMVSEPTAAAACRLCAAPLCDVFVDLGASPLCESYLTQRQINQVEAFYPLNVWVCRECLLVQMQEYVAPEAIFREYAYFSAVSRSWLEHARRYAEAMQDWLPLGSTSKVVELGSNDGYLLQYFVERGIPALGVEPARNVAL